MSRRSAWFLIVAAGWTAYVWISRLYLMAGSDDSTGFKVVHAVIAVISLAFGAGVGWIGIRALRRRRPAGRGARIGADPGSDRDPADPVSVSR
ncbi:MAG: hypothetical protein R3A49_08555 [Acidimicrobiia bacterium]